MKQWATIVNRRVRRVFETSDSFIPEFGPPLEVVEITALATKPTPGANYDRRTKTFSARTKPVQPSDDDVGEALALVEALNWPTV